jgi:glutamate--cysteine ligase
VARVCLTMIDRTPFVQSLAREAFGIGRPADLPPRVGAEVELIPVSAVSGRPCAIEQPGEPSTLPVLRRVGQSLGWEERRSPKAGVVEFTTADRGRITFEPGGQIEYSAPPATTLTALLDSLIATTAAVTTACDDAGIELLSVGIDPENRVSDVPLRLDADRYRRMDAHFASIGAFGARMMRQTASIQVCLDSGADPLTRWRLLNALAPHVVALFANSPLYAGIGTGHQSYRRFVWSQLDPLRTGVVEDATDPVGAYADFALAAPALLLGSSGEAEPFATWVDREAASRDDWQAHLTTLFPEVRPRGYFEVRSCDALPPEWYPAPIVFLAGIAYHEPSARAALEIVSAPTEGRLARAGRCGLHDRELASASLALVDLAVAGAESLGSEWVAPKYLDAAHAYFDRFTRRRRAPADDTLSTIGA